jgi:hypothetical protein
MASASEIVIEQPRGLGAFTIGDLGVFIGTIGGVITSILIVLQKSKCKSICWGCCERDVNANMEEENNNNQNNAENQEQIIPDQNDDNNP